MDSVSTLPITESMLFSAQSWTCLHAVLLCLSFRFVSVSLLSPRSITIIDSVWNRLERIIVRRIFLSHQGPRHDIENQITTLICPFDEHSEHWCIIETQSKKIV
jgi:hypothetical protein